jgi:hypothetical protein
VQSYENGQYITIYEDANYMIWVDTDEQIANVFLEEKELTLHFTYEDFQAFRESMNSLISAQMDERTDDEIIDVYLEGRELTLHFGCEDFYTFRDILNNLEMLPKWWLCWS